MACLATSRPVTAMGPLFGTAAGVIRRRMEHLFEVGQVDRLDRIAVKAGFAGFDPVFFLAASRNGDKQGLAGTRLAAELAQCHRALRIGDGEIGSRLANARGASTIACGQEAKPEDDQNRERTLHISIITESRRGPRGPWDEQFAGTTRCVCHRAGTQRRSESGGVPTVAHRPIGATQRNHRGG